MPCVWFQERQKITSVFTDDELREGLTDQFADHIVIFSLAGIAAVPEKLESQKKDN